VLAIRPVPTIGATWLRLARRSRSGRLTIEATAALGVHRAVRSNAVGALTEINVADMGTVSVSAGHGTWQRALRGAQRAGQ
jgi:hypothetical protein